MALEANARNCAVLQTQYNKSKAYIDTFSRRHSYAPGVKIADQDLAPSAPTTRPTSRSGSARSMRSTLIRTTRAWTASDRDLSEKMMAFAAGLRRHRQPGHQGRGMAGLVAGRTK